jgi:hypothetical protein
VHRVSMCMGTCFANVTLGSRNWTRSLGGGWRQGPIRPAVGRQATGQAMGAFPSGAVPTPSCCLAVGLNHASTHRWAGQGP